MKLRITINDGSLAGQAFELENGFLSVGRADSCSIRFNPLVETVASKQHAFIESKFDGFYITDNQSTNGTFVNDARITSPTRLANGDKIQFGRNGITAFVSMAGDSVPTIPRDEFRDLQVEEFNKKVAGSQSIQSSLGNFGLNSAAVVKTEPDSTKKYIGIGVTLFVLVFLSLIVAAIMFFSIGPIAAVIATIVAFVPAMIYLMPVLWLDRYDPEPVWLLALAFAWGALVAVIISFVVNTLFGIAVGMAISPDVGQAAGAVMSAPIFEEGSKGIGLLIILIFFRKYFDDILDGIVFASVIALGFATVENVLYYGRGLLGGGFGGLMLLFVLRGIMSPFAHATFTSMTGIGCGIARESHNKAVRILMPVVGYFGAVLLHAIWNGMAVLGGTEGFLLGYVIGEIPFFLIFVGFSLYIMRRQGKILKEMLAIDVARGLISPELEAKATSAFRGFGWVVSGLFEGKFGARARYLRAVGKLGLSYWHIQRATRAKGETASFQQNPLLRDEVLRLRDQV
ncbi:MAG: FHA domain-containing protein [Acidobacteria bacterium OLB17]|nr:MAG: FHA domain-containing protein [Acidobacteria bacterium OLB17]MCZ2389551.1 PrsW family intramembrane metalloprotease [Acidobacteriota bacterium]